MSNVKKFIELSLKNGAPVNFSKMQFKSGSTYKKKVLICKKYETKSLRASEFYKPITCFIDYSKLKDILAHKTHIK